jgi:hypothetical protein
MASPRILGVCGAAKVECSTPKQSMRPLLTNPSESRRNCYSPGVRYLYQYWYMTTVHPVISKTQ